MACTLLSAPPLFGMLLALSGASLVRQALERSEQTLRGRNREEFSLGVGQAKRQICRDRNCKSGKKLARSAHLPQKLANQAQYRHVTGQTGSSERLDPVWPIFFDCCKITHVYFFDTPFRDSRAAFRQAADETWLRLWNFFARTEGQADR